MIQSSPEWDYEPDAPKQRTEWSFWRKGKAAVNTEMTKRSPLLYSEVYNTKMEAFLEETYKKYNDVFFPLMNHAVSVALAVLDACWTMQ